MRDGEGPAPDSAPDASPDAAPDSAPDAVPDAACEPQGPEVCNGTDDDCDGVVDGAGACGDFIVASCTVALGFAERGDAPEDGSARWGDCPVRSNPNHDRLPCNQTQGESRFRPVFVDDHVREGDQLGLAFFCEGGPVAEYVEDFCRLLLGHSTAVEPEAQPSWGPCPERAGVDGDQRCVDTDSDGRYHLLTFPGLVDADDAVGVAFVCTDRLDPRRAEALQASVEVFLGWGHGRAALLASDGEASWAGCPQAARVAGGELRCVGTGGDGAFHSIPLGSVPDGRVHAFAVMLRARTR